MSSTAPDPEPDLLPGRSGEPVDERYLVPALIRGLAVLQAFSRERQNLSLSELAAAIGVTRSAAYRLVYTLDHLGFLTHDPRSRSYALGPQVLRLGYGFLAGRDIVAVAMPFLEALRDRTGWSAHLGVLEGAEVLYLARAATRRAVASNVEVGSRLPAHATAMGRVLLSALDAPALARLYGGDAMRRFTATTPGSLAALSAQLAEDGARGYAISSASFEAGVAAVAAPVRDVTGRVVAAINISTVAGQAGEAELAGGLRAAVTEAAAALSAALGHVPGG
ncbi:helix-turn-helix domain-containing protein [Roseomonas sp. NAR14]|uniref:Helix-turn-helix domain-containing protein n=1 Tax=Roseomonas acroporae TaxID=2937791 RepID=A0A9X1YB23_9PROT|nr:IclR family transcriptional regulator C-terminal domain-containing protein [Roseomonas acroporae]MCK8786158.1 helix-turn-helix domain-containing protein [Roseomonas acroporae]